MSENRLINDVKPMILLKSLFVLSLVFCLVTDKLYQFC